MLDGDDCQADADGGQFAGGGGDGGRGWFPAVSEVGGGHRAAAFRACQAASIARSARTRYTISATPAAATAVRATAATASAGPLMVAPPTVTATWPVASQRRTSRAETRAVRCALLIQATSPSASLPRSPVRAAAGCQTVTVLAPAAVHTSAAGALILTRVPCSTEDGPVRRYSHSYSPPRLISACH